MKNILEYKKISKSFFGFPALKEVSFSLNPGEILALVGENGAGKSTMMNILGGVLQPTEGEIKFKGKEFKPLSPKAADDAGIALIHQELNLFENLSVMENVLLPDYPKRGNFPLIQYRAAYEETKKLLDEFLLNVNPDALVESLSPGDKQLIEIIKAIRKNADVYVFDEPTTSLTLKEKEVLFRNIGELKKKEKAIIYVSHALEDVMNLSDSILVLRDGQVNSSGPTSQYTVSKIIEDMVGRTLKEVYPPNHGTSPTDTFLELKNFGKKGLVENVNFEVRKGEIVGLFGLMGSGRTELARMVFGLDAHSEGEIFFRGEKIKKINPAKAIRKGIAFITEDRRGEGLMMDASILANQSLVVLKDFVRKFSRRIDGKNLLRASQEMESKLKLKSKDWKQKVKTLSGGNQQKVVLGKWLLSGPGMLILDEPTRGIDVGAKYEIYSILNDLAKTGIAIWVISSELDELIGICDRISVMSRGRLSGSFKRENFNDREIVSAAFENQ